ncbi:hypothetical protein [Streptomyces sp. NPDC002088]
MAGKTTRTDQQHPEGISTEDLARETELSSGQIELGMMWKNLDFPC